MTGTNLERYRPSMRALHWVVAVCIIGALLLGFYMNLLPRELRGDGWWLHKSLGLTALLLWPLRLGLRQMSPLPALHGAKMERLLAHAVHRLMYVAMLLMPLSGYVMLAAKGKVPVWFGIDLPIVMAPNPALAKLAHHWHEPLAYAVLVLLALHVAGLLKHWLIDKRNPLKPML